MRRKRYSVMFPVSFGVVSGLLMIWDLHNYGVIESMGMAWDMGPPVWPYEASWIALLAINAPAYVLSTPLFLVCNLQTAPLRYPLLFPAIVILWWWLGRRLDHGLLPSRRYRHYRWVGTGFAAAALCMYFVGIRFVLDYASWYSQYGRLGFNLRLLRTIGPMLWCFLIAVTLSASAFRVIQTARAHQCEKVTRNRGAVQCDGANTANQ
jgi:hypothetical protein